MTSKCSCILLLFVLLHASTCDSEKPPLQDGRGKRLRILLVSDSLMGHLARILALGDELAQRGHNVTQFLALHEHQQVKYKKHVEKHGVHLWNVSSEELVDFDMDELTKQVAKNFFTVMVGKFSQYGVLTMSIMAKHINKSLSAGDWDLVIGIDYVPIVISCLSSVHNIPFVFVGKLEGAFHLLPAWSWPALLYGAQSDNMNFIDRLLYLPSKVAMQAFITTLCYPSRRILTEYCPAVSLHQALTTGGVHIPTIVANAIILVLSFP